MPAGPVDVHALRAFVLYGLACGVVGEWFPFTQVPMYAELGATERHEAAVPIFRVGGERVDWKTLDRFVGPDPDDVLPWPRPRANGEARGFPSSDPRDRDISDWIRSHRGDQPGPTAVEVAYLVLVQRPDGGYDQAVVPVWEGTAWPRR